MLQGSSHIVFAPTIQFIELKVFEFSLVFHFAFEQTVLIPQLLDFPFHLVFQAFVLKIFHFQRLFEFGNLELHQTPAIILGSFYLSYLLH